MQLDHATIVTPDLHTARRFFVEVAGLTEGARPPFSVDGYWLYANGRPVVHLIEATVPAVSGRAAPRIDHVAFRVESASEWQALVGRVQASAWPHQLAEVPASGPQPREVQLFAALAPGVVIEFVTAAQYASASLQDEPKSSIPSK